MHAQKFDAIVIGGGLAGLTAAAYLARAGREVALLEKSSLLGGRAITRNVQGFSFNLGAHALYLGGPAEQILHELGVAYSGKTPDLSRYMGAYESTIAQLPVSLKNTITSGLFTMREKLELARLFAVLARSDHTQLEGTSLQTWAEKNVERPRIREFLYMFSRLTTYTHAPELVDAAFVLNFWRTQPTVLYLDHGWQTLIEGLKRVAQGAGVQLMPNSRVVELEYAADQVSGVRLANDTILEAGAVILATEAEPALDLLGERKSASLRTWEQSRHQLYAAVLDLGLRRLPQPQHAYVLGIDRPFCSVAMSERARLAPQGQVLLHTIRYLHPAAPGDARAIYQEMEEWLDLIQPGWRAEVVEKQFLPHLQVTGGMVQARTGGLSAMPQPEHSGVANVFLVGDWIGSEAHLAGASFASARRAAQSVLQYTRQPVSV